MTNIKFKWSSKKDGPMNLTGHNEIDFERIANRGEFLAKNFGVRNVNSVIPKLQHGSKIESVFKSNYENADTIYLLECDGIMTDVKGLALTITAGDCYPVFIYCPENEVICLLHVGWRGLADKIVEKAILALYTQFGCWMKDVHIQVGPGICKQCYEVGPDVWKAFGYDFIKSKMNFNLLNEIEGQAAIIPPRNLHFNSCDHICTFHNDEYYSARRDGNIYAVPHYQFAVAIIQDDDK